MPHNQIDKVQRARAKQLRLAMTRAETLLWHCLKAHPLSRLGFSRQSPMVNNVANFVEVNGEGHDFEERIGHDEVCDRWFPSRGYGVLRLANDEVIRNLGGAALAILEAAEQAAPPSLTLPRKGGGNGISPSLGKQGDV